MHVNDIQVTKIPKRVLDETPKSLKGKCKTLKIGDAIPVKSLGWAANLKTQLEESTDFKFKYWSEPQISYYKYVKLDSAQRSKIRVFIGRIA